MKGAASEAPALGVNVEAPIPDDLDQDVGEEPEERRRVHEEGEERTARRQAARAGGELDDALEALGPRIAGGEARAATHAAEMTGAPSTQAAKVLCKYRAAMLEPGQSFGLHVGAAARREARLTGREAHGLAAVASLVAGVSATSADSLATLD